MSDLINTVLAIIFMFVAPIVIQLLILHSDSKRKD